MHLKALFIALFFTLTSHSYAQEMIAAYTVSDSHKYVWFRVAKVGTRSIYQILGEHTQISYDGGDNRYSFNSHPDYFKFAFVRNPWDRIVSCYCNKVVTKVHPAFSECFGKSFDDFVDFIATKNLANADRHIRLQTKLIPVQHLDFIGRFENFSEDLLYVLDRLEIPPVEIPHKNQSKHVHYSEYYTERTKAIIAAKYKDDIIAFGYQFSDK